MLHRRLTPYQRLPESERRVVDEWQAIVSRRVEGADGVIRLPQGSMPQLEALYQKCTAGEEWSVSAETASKVACSIAYQAVNAGDFQVALNVLNRFQRHPGASWLDQSRRDRHSSLMAAADLMSGDVTTAVNLWNDVMAQPGARPLTIFYDFHAACNVLGATKPGAEIDPQLLPVVKLLKSKSKGIQAIGEGARKATYAELAGLLEAARLLMWTRKQAKLGKPAK